MMQLMAVLENLCSVDPILHSAVLVNWSQLAPNNDVLLTACNILRGVARALEQAQQKQQLRHPLCLTICCIRAAAPA